MTAVSLSRPLPPELEKELQAESVHLASALGQQVLRQPGCAGVLSSSFRSSVWVFGLSVDTAALLARLSAAGTSPAVLTHESSDVDLAALHAAGWTPEHVTVWLRRSSRLPSRPLPTGCTSRRLARDDLPAMRALVDQAFGTDDSHLVLPDSLVDVPGVQLLGVHDRAGRLLATVGVRDRLRSRLLFALATAPAQRSRGIGAALLTAAARVPSPDSTERPVDVESTPGALGLYERLGFAHQARWQRWAPAA